MGYIKQGKKTIAKKAVGCREKEEWLMADWKRRMVGGAYKNDNVSILKCLVLVAKVYSLKNIFHLARYALLQQGT